jgi:hypothetical protein
MLQVITPTGDRPEAWALCQRWMQHQRYPGPVRWYIVDDGVEPSAITFNRPHYVVRSFRLSTESGNTQARNLRFLLEQIDPRDPVVVWEDDDYYGPDWLTTIDALIGQAELIGETAARYYNVARPAGRELRNYRHASLCATALRGAAIEALKQGCQTTETYLDLQLWQSQSSKLLFPGHQVIGMKGLPGRPGIGMGHREDFRGIPDPSGQLLYRWIGEDSAVYRQFAGRSA